jgi:hypothetical protein
VRYDAKEIRTDRDVQSALEESGIRVLAVHDAPMPRASERSVAAVAPRRTISRPPRARIASSSAAIAAQKNAARRGDARRRAIRVGSSTSTGTTSPNLAASASPR